MQVPKILPSGRIVDLFAVKPQDIFAWDIAWSLAHTNRFTGACAQPWDVASHTGLVMNIAKTLSPSITKDTFLAILLHDAAEAYLGDVTSFLKNTPTMAWFCALEETYADVIHERFGLQSGEVDWDLIKEADRLAGITELNFFWPNSAGEYPDLMLAHEDTGIPLEKVSARMLVQAIKGHAPADLSPSIFELPDNLAPFAVKPPLSYMIESGTGPLTLDDEPRTYSADILGGKL